VSFLSPYAFESAVAMLRDLHLSVQSEVRRRRELGRELPRPKTAHRRSFAFRELAHRRGNTWELSRSATVRSSIKLCLLRCLFVNTSTTLLSDAFTTRDITVGLNRKWYYHPQSFSTNRTFQISCFCSALVVLFVRELGSKF
jgi:hypothetical protein